MKEFDLSFLRLMAMALAISWLVAVGCLAAWKAASGPGADRCSWPEVFHGPALTVGSTFLGLVGVDRLLRSRK